MDPKESALTNRKELRNFRSPALQNKLSVDVKEIRISFYLAVVGMSYIEDALRSPKRMPKFRRVGKG